MNLKNTSQLLRGRGFRVSLLLLTAALVGFQWRFRTAQTQTAQAAQKTQEQLQFADWEAKIPLRGGRALNDTGGKVLGNPHNAIEDLKRLYQLMAIYREKHNGKSPTTTMELLLAARQQPKEYGFRDKNHVEEAFLNPDTRYADNVPTRRFAHRHSPYNISDKRPDGTLAGGPKPAGTRDVIASADLYFHRNIRHFRGERSTENPVGFYLVLWEDGEIQKIPYSEQIYARAPKGKFAFGFAGQAGIAPNSLSYDEWYRNLGWKNGGPRGKEGGVGLSYNTTIKKLSKP